MKKNLLIFLFMVLVATIARAEKTYIKNRTECHFNGDKIFVDIRSKNLITDKADNEYGEVIEVRQGKNIYALKMTDKITSRYRFAKTQEAPCFKPLTDKVNERTLGVFIMKDNRPFADKLMMLYYNAEEKSLSLVSEI